MEICLRAFQTIEQLEKADEILVIWEKRDIIPDIIEKYPDKTIVLEVPYFYFINEEEQLDIKMYYGLSRGKFKLSCDAGQEDLGFPFFYNFPIQDYYSLYKILQIPEVTDVIIGGSLVFDIKRVSERIRAAKKKVRVIPNLAYSDTYPCKDGVLGSWIRPEDLDAYSEYIDVIEFKNVQESAAREAALYRIYIEKKAWDGDLQELITNLNYPGVNRMVPPEISQERMTCGHACVTRGRNCRLCYTMLDLANPDLYKGNEQFNEKFNDRGI